MNPVFAFFIFMLVSIFLGYLLSKYLDRFGFDKPPEEFDCEEGDKKAKSSDDDFGDKVRIFGPFFWS